MAYIRSGGGKKDESIKYSVGKFMKADDYIDFDMSKENAYYYMSNRAGVAYGDIYDGGVCNIGTIINGIRNSIYIYDVDVSRQSVEYNDETKILKCICKGGANNMSAFSVIHGDKNKFKFECGTYTGTTITVETNNALFYISNRPNVANGNLSDAGVGYIGLIKDGFLRMLHYYDVYTTGNFSYQNGILTLRRNQGYNLDYYAVFHDSTIIQS